MLKDTDKSVVKYVGDTKCWCKGKCLHRDGGPAIECANGSKCWYRNGNLHRDDGPAIESANGDRYWYKDGKRHRDDGSAVIFANGDKYWYRSGKLHRDAGPAIEYASGDKHWYRDGKRFYPCDVVSRDEVVKMLEILLDIIDWKIDPDKEWWVIGTECMTVGEMKNRARALLERIRQEKQKKLASYRGHLYDPLDSEGLSGGKNNV